jgi:anti-sigma B factor antagonist
MAMPIQVEKKGEMCHVAIEGEMTIYVAQELKSELLSPIAENDVIEVDLSQVSEIDAAGLQLMLVTKIESVARGIKLSFVNCSASVQEMLQLSNLEQFFGDPLLIEQRTD